MKISYCGMALEERSPMMELHQGEVAGQFQRSSWGYHYPRHIPSRPRQLHRRHRNIIHLQRYQGQNTRTILCAQTTPNFCSLSLQKCCTVAVNPMEKAHLGNMRRSLERRLQIAKASGDHKLISLLEDESQALALN